MLKTRQDLFRATYAITSFMCVVSNKSGHVQTNQKRSYHKPEKLETVILLTTAAAVATSRLSAFLMPVMSPRNFCMYSKDDSFDSEARWTSTKRWCLAPWSLKGKAEIAVLSSKGPSQISPIMVNWILSGGDVLQRCLAHAAHMLRQTWHRRMVTWTHEILSKTCKRYLNRSCGRSDGWNAKIVRKHIAHSFAHASCSHKHLASCTRNSSAFKNPFDKLDSRVYSKQRIGTESGKNTILKANHCLNYVVWRPKSPSVMPYVHFWAAGWRTQHRQPKLTFCLC